MGSMLSLAALWVLKMLLLETLIPAFTEWTKNSHDKKVDEDNLKADSETDEDEILEEIKEAESNQEAFEVAVKE
jgi:hypothetical protein